MKYDPQIHHRHSIRLKAFDYSQPGAYFFTVVTVERVNLFGKIVNGAMRLNDIGRIVRDTWMDLPNHYPYLELGTFVVMPNHVHGIVILTAQANGANQTTVGAGLRPAPTRTMDTPTVPRRGLAEIVRAFKSFSARRINQCLGSIGQPLWQRNYFEHVIRNQKEWERLHCYIEANPMQWVKDRENPAFEEKQGQVSDLPIQE